MPMHLRFGPEDLLRCRFAISPLCETHEAVRTLRRTGRHGYHQPWLRRMRAAVAGLDLSELWLFMPRSGYIPDFLGPPPDAPFESPASFDAELARLRATDPVVAHREMVRSLACTPGAAQSPLGRTMLDDPGRAVQRLADLTERVWTALIADDWTRLRAVMEADVAYRTRKLAESGLESLFAGLHANLSWNEGTLTLRTVSSALIGRDLHGRGLLLMPSVFVWPDVVSGFAPPWQPTVIYPARGMAGLWRDSPPSATRDPLARLLGPNRAAILRGLHVPATTTVLASQYGLAPSSVSAHLTVLREAGLLTSRRQGHQVLYARTPLGEALVDRIRA
ncbi:helix-turn-helix domain-containing protein [Nonomuraea phyllanthi]|uniref:Helix-turn-helix domain-containing protein n=2 Tax=Nonomuraea phyllanthi TaxID=2219224 RepID=A0A5C4W4U6_9ACTN|nr:helix-turn-helix domain-containing protein [Nonomuraea phyllanthi]